MILDYAYYAALNAIIMAVVLYYFAVDTSILIKVTGASFILMTIRMIVQFQFHVN